MKVNRWKKGNWSKIGVIRFYRVKIRLLEEYKEIDNVVKINVRERRIRWVVEKVERV